MVVAHGGFSGVFPQSSEVAYNLAVMTSGPEVSIWCDVQLTKDEVGICLPNVILDNSTFISYIFPNKSTTYNVNNVPTNGYFSLDYTLKDLSNVPCKFNSVLNI